MKRALLALFIVACATEPPPTATPDAGSDTPDAAAPPDAAVQTCALGALPSGLSATWGARLTLDIPGAITLVPPDGWRADGLSLRAPYATGAAEIGVRLDCENGLTTTATVRIDVVAPRWSKLRAWAPSSGPVEWLKPTMWIDPVDPDRMLVLGGLGPDFRFDAELWSYDLAGTRWDLLGDLGRALAIKGGMVAPKDGASSVVVIDEQAGLGPGTQAVSRVEYAETPQVTTLAPDAPTDGWYGGAFFYDAALDRYVVACGATASSSQCDVLIYDASTGTWEEATVEGAAPAGRFGFAYAWDEAEQRMIMFSGATRITAGRYVSDDETWILELGARPFRWHRLEPTGTTEPTVYGCSVLDAINNRLLVFAGGLDQATTHNRLYALDLDLGFERWEQIDISEGPEARTLCTATVDRARHRALFGFGTSPAGSFADLWSLVFSYISQCPPTQVIWMPEPR